MLLAPAFINGYPTLNPDDNTYLLSGFLFETPFDRPIAYGILLRLLSGNGGSLWLAVAVQGWCVAWLVIKLMVLANGNKLRPSYCLVAVLLLSLCTSLSWISSQLIPDVFTPIAGMCLALILFGRERQANLVVLYVLFTVAICTHLSHVVIFTLLLLALLLLRRFFFTYDRLLKCRRALLALLLAGVSIATMGSALSKSKHVFAIGAMLEQGILKPYLDEHCPTENYKLCAYKDSLPKDANIFLWDEQASPLYKTGGWAANKADYSAIFNGSITERKYILLHLQASVVSTARQALSFHIGDGVIPFTEGTTINATVRKYLPPDVRAFTLARQQQGRLIPYLTLPNVIIDATVAVSAVFLLIAGVFYRRRMSAALKGVLSVLLLLILINVWDCATFAQVNGRYGCRVMWIIPFCAAIVAVQWRSYLRIERTSSDNIYTDLK